MIVVAAWVLRRPRGLQEVPKPPVTILAVERIEADQTEQSLKDMPPMRAGQPPPVACGTLQRPNHIQRCVGYRTSDAAGHHEYRSPCDQAIRGRLSSS
jgi:hypothetical protein